MLSLSAHHIHNVDIDDLKTMWAVFTKCKAHLENGRRLENMSWRLWYHEKKSNSTSSTAYFSYMSALASSFASSSASSSPVPAYSSSPVAASTSSTINSDTIHNTNTCVKRSISSKGNQDDWSRHSQQHNTTKAEALDNNNNNNSTNGTAEAAVSATDAAITKQISNNGILQQSHDRQTQQQQQQSAISHHPSLKPRTSVIQIDPGDDDDDEEYFENVDNDNNDDNDKLFNKSKPIQRSSTSRSSLLTEMLKNDNRATMPTTATVGSAAPNTKSARDHFLCKELSESLRRNVLWEQIQQRALYPGQLYRNHPTAGLRPRKQQGPRNINHRNNMQHTEWMESFHGW
ncbi:DUF1752-domain-containing protein [Lichtheimia hyalospora FSU 10163]|nr:DUF1752-domain-containing protein [Lichtheimia hyalospora FSU 10163]